MYILKKTGLVLNVRTGHASENTSYTNNVMVNGNLITNRTDIANEICTYVANIGKQYAETIPSSRKTSKSYVTSASNPFFVRVMKYKLQKSSDFLAVETAKFFNLDRLIFCSYFMTDKLF